MSTDPTTTPVSPIPAVVDYTGRDFYSLREDLITRVKDRVNANSASQWYGNDPADFGVALIEAFAYMGDVVSYYVDRIANEANIITATQRSSIYNLALSYGYTPAGYKSATCTVQFVNTTATHGLATLPAGTQLSGTIVDGETVRRLIFTTTEDAVLAASKSVSAISGSGTAVTYTLDNSGGEFVVGHTITVTGASTAGFNVTDEPITAATTTTVSVASTATGSTSTATATTYVSPVSVPAVHGEYVDLRDSNVADPLIPGDINGELVGVSDGSTFQSYRLKETSVVQGSVSVYVQEGSSYGQWTEFIHLIDAGPTTSAYSVYTDANNNTFIRFGDGISGAIPNPYARIKVNYLTGGGTVGNIPLNTLTQIVKAPGIGSIAPYTVALSVSNTTLGTGGANPESVESVRVNAPQSFSTNNRAVTLVDYRRLALGVPTVGKSNATASIWSSVVLYVAPRRDLNASDVYPGKNDSNTAVTSEWTAIQNEVQNYLADKLQIGVSLTVSPPTYSPVSLKLSYSKLPDYSATQVEDAIKAYINSYYSYSAVTFEQTINPEDIEFILRYVPGVFNIRVNSLRRASDASDIRSTIVGNPGEIFIFRPTDIVIDAWNTTATLATLSASNTAAFVPTFASGTLDYATSLTSGTTTTLDMTPTDMASTIRVTGSTLNNAVAYSGGVATSLTGVAIPVGTTVFTIVVTAEDGTTTKTYTLTITRA